MNNEVKVDANQVIQKLNGKLAEANLEITILELQVQQLKDLLARPAEQEVVVPTEVIE